MKKRHFFLAMLACSFVLIAYFRISLTECPAGLGNKLGFLLQNNYFIPKESNVCVFETTMQGEGSGGGWVYGEDDKYYYGLSLRSESRADNIYYFILRKGQESQNFNRFDYYTWNKREGVNWLPKKLRPKKYTGDIEE